MRASPSRRTRIRWRAFAVLAPLFAAGAAADEALRGATLVAQAEDREAAGETTGAEEPGDAADESGGEPPSGIEVIHVRGRSATDIATDVPASVTSFDASTIEALGAQDISDLARVTPNVNIVQPGATQANFFIRGIGLSDFSANSQGAVTIFQDDVALDLPAIQTGQLFDIQSVDLVRGPQGSGPYRNASAGAIRVGSNLPTGNYGAQLRSTIGRYAADGGKGVHHAKIQDYEGYLEVPIVEGSLASRFAFRLRNSDPFKTNGCGNEVPFAARSPRPVQSNLVDAVDICGERGFDTFPLNQPSRIRFGLPRKVDFSDRWAARGFLRFRPEGSEIDIVLNAHGSRLDEDQSYGQAIGTAAVQGRGNPFGGATGTTQFGYHEPDQRAELDQLCGTAPTCPSEVIARFEKNLAEERPLDIAPYRGDYNREGITTRDTWGGYLRNELVLGDLDLFLLASYDEYTRLRDQDTDAVPDVLFETAEEDEAWQTYEEIRLAGELAGTALEWELGGYFLEANLDSDAIITLSSPIPDRPTSIQRIFAQDTRSFGVWGKFVWYFLDDLTLQGGVRYNWEHKDFEIARLRRVFGNAFPPQTAENDETWQTPTGNLILTYHLDNEVSTFLKYGRGFKAGHFNALASDDLTRPPADPEFNDAWEAGLNGAWFDGRLSGTAAYFYYRYQDYQVFLFRDIANSPPVLEIVNAEEAENYGVELEGRIEPLRGWAPTAIERLTLSWNFGWLHGEFLDFQLRSTIGRAQNIIPVISDFSGDRLMNSPEFKFSASATWTFELGQFGYLVPRYDAAWSDESFFGVNEGRGSPDLFGNPKLPELAVGQPAFWLHHVRLAYRTPTQNVELAVWCRNLEDTVYKTFAFDASTFSNVVLNFVGEPRTIGVDFTVTF